MTELEQALSLFATQRSAAVADAIEDLGRAAIERFQPPTARKNLEFHRAWQALAREPAARTWCLDTLLDKLPKLLDGEEHVAGDKCDAVVERLDTLTALAPDPRIARAVLALAELRSPVCGFTFVFQAMARAVVRHADDATASAPALRELTDVEEAAAIITGKLPALAAPPAAPRRRIARRDPSELYAAVYAEPDADGPREVLADALQEVGDPRGELIMLQLREARGDTSDEVKERARALVRTHGKTWLGPLRPITYRAELRRGFVARLELAGSWSSGKWAELSREPMLATVEELGAGQATGKIYAQVLDALHGVRAVHVFDDAIWSIVEHAALPRLAELTVLNWKRHDAGERFASRVAPWLEHRPQITRLHCAPQYLASLSKARIAQLTELALPGELREALPRWKQLPQLRSLTVGWTDPVVLRRDNGREIARVLASRQGTSLPALDQLPRSITRVEIVGNRTLAKELRAAHAKRFEIVDLSPPSGIITGVK